MIDFTCKTCGKEVTSICGGLCDLCRFLLLGEKMNDSSDYSFETHDGIVLWIKDFKVDSIWVEGGSRSIPMEIFTGKSPIVIIESLREFDKYCTVCHDKVLEFSHTHFGGAYCKSCSTKYKDAYSSKCLLCRSPRYECCC